MSNFHGNVISGKGRGKGLGVPTLNLEVKENCPAHGIYAAWVRFGDHGVHGHRVKGALHVGPRPTFHEEDVSVEVHLLDFEKSSDVGDEVKAEFPKLGDTVGVEVVGWIRDVEMFDSPEALKKRIESDIVMAQKLLSDDPSAQK